jgi:pseudouridine synthase
MSKMRLQKYLAEKGIASRRKAEEYIQKGLVKINGEVRTEMGISIDTEKDSISFCENELAKEEAKLVYYALNKPKGYVSACVTHTNESLVLDLVPSTPRVFPVGRLDKESEGLLILTNDGRITFQLTHPSKKHEKEYQVWVQKPISDYHLSCLESGVRILGETVYAKKIRRLDEYSFCITLTEGKNRQIRRMCRVLGYSVQKLRRIRIGAFRLGSLPSGKYKVLSLEEVMRLRGE